jgi:endonuclease YncB( thermonuclease family)
LTAQEIRMAPKGLLTVAGSIDIDQFWPATKGSRSSDADTVHMKVDPQTSFLFASSPATTPKTTTKFVDAHVFDHGKKNVITSKSEIKIRLQGLDAPELHFPITVPRDPSKTGKGNEFRQPFGARAASALLDFLKGFVPPGGGSRIFATFLTHIDHPGDAIDSHGRFVGDIIVGTAASTNINTWLVENGWAYPLFYDSMTKDEIRTLLAAWKVGRAIAGRPGKAWRRPLQPFDPARTVKNAALPDNGALNIPKLFRRQATFWAQLPGPLTPAEFKAKIDLGLTGKTDKAYRLNYFLAHIAKPDRKKRIPLASRIGAQGQALFDPPDLVFAEDPSTLLDANDKPIKSWT